MDAARVRAPELAGAGEWIGTDALSLADLRGKLVLLDFWTTGCVNCQHVAEELRALERRYAEVLIVIGVHSPKFPHERDADVVRAAVARMRVEHPVLSDPALRLWDAYAVRAWPTLVLIDAAGRVALTVAGEGHDEQLASAIDVLIAEAEAAGVLRRGPLALTPVAGGTGELAFPGKVAVGDGAGGDVRLAVADSGHDRVLVTTLGGEVLHELGGFYQPQGVRFDGPAASASALLVCETGAGRVWRVELGHGVGDPGRRELLTDRLKSPWDVCRWAGHVVIAEAGRHRLWAIDRSGEPQVIAGTGGENLVDGPANGALLAQPSGLTVSAHDELVFVDAETSALRVLDRPGGAVRTLVGQGLFVSGTADGSAERARLQHPLGVAAARDGALLVADTYNGLVRVWRGEHLWTVPVEGFSEPGGIDVLPDGRLVVADTGNHRVVLVDPVDGRAEAIDVGGSGSGDIAGPGTWAPAAVAATVIARAGGVLDVELDLPLDGDELDGLGGAPVRVTASALDPALLGDETAWSLDALPARVAVPLGHGSGRITVELRVATCDGALCRLRRTQRAFDVILTD
ncbi:Thiol-disulfide oxidoreductase ResA [Paraconexibacter sp. AEG42_29]|uniref:Thiol-disulfide oxidoreductase ResA n=1 Tax=Paraconexibacter sp. AEG42_29 TaxID=2997339 RepID=A0AAU7APZ3_9ACTN